MRAAMLLLPLAGLAPAPAHAQGAGDAAQARALCAQNPAFGVDIMRSVIEEQRRSGQNPDLDQADPDRLARQAADRGIADCAADMAREPALFDTLAAQTGTDATIGWDAFNVACASHAGSMAACITAEISSARALKRMSAGNRPPGATALVETCALVLPQTPPMAEWRACVDIALSVRAPEAAALACKTNVPWHSASNGAAAGRIVAACLGQVK